MKGVFGAILIYIIFCVFKEFWKNTKILFSKKTYQIDNSHKIRDFAEIGLIVVLIAVIIFMVLVNGFLIKMINTGCSNENMSYYEVRYQVMAANSTISRYLQNMPKNEKEFLSNLKNSNIKNFVVYNYGGLENVKYVHFPKKYIKTDKKPDGFEKNLAENVPAFRLGRSLYFVNSFKNECQTADFKNPEKSDCLITVDLNGFDGPNKLIKFDKDFDWNKDRVKSAGGDQIMLLILSDTETMFPALPDEYAPLRIFSKSKNNK